MTCIALGNSSTAYIHGFLQQIGCVCKNNCKNWCNHHHQRVQTSKWCNYQHGQNFLLSLLHQLTPAKHQDDLEMSVWNHRRIMSVMWVAQIKTYWYAFLTTAMIRMVAAATTMLSHRAGPWLQAQYRRYHGPQHVWQAVLFSHQCQQLLPVTWTGVCSADLRTSTCYGTW